MSQAAPTSPFLEWPGGLVLVLASASPRRAQLLETAGIPFEVRPVPEAEPEVAGPAEALRGDPEAYARLLAGAKAAAGSGRAPRRLVLGADTIVVLDGEILGKPIDQADAVRMLGRLSGRRHTVVTALSLRGPGLGGAGGGDGAPLEAAESTLVWFRPLSRRDIERYVETGEPMDKAGAYGIQGYGSLMIARIEGCYFNVMGLPLPLLGRLLATALADGAADPAPGGEG